MKKSLVLVSLLFLASLSVIGTDVFAEDEYDKEANRVWDDAKETGEHVKNQGFVGRAIDMVIDKVTDDTRQMSSSNSDNDSDDE